jgi:hypothetical protein
MELAVSDILFFTKLELCFSTFLPDLDYGEHQLLGGSVCRFHSFFFSSKLWPHHQAGNTYFTGGLHSILDRELIQRFEFSSYYDAKKHIEQYIYDWYNDRRRHKEIGRITPNQKWAQGQWWSSDKQRVIGSAQVVSRPADSLENQSNNQPLRISLDTTWADPYLGLSDDRHGESLYNQIENSVQRIGG